MLETITEIVFYLSIAGDFDVSISTIGDTGLVPNTPSKKSGLYDLGQDVKLKVSKGKLEMHTKNLLSRDRMIDLFRTLIMTNNGSEQYASLCVRTTTDFYLPSVELENIVDNRVFSNLWNDKGLVPNFVSWETRPTPNAFKRELIQFGKVRDFKIEEQTKILYHCEHSLIQKNVKKEDIFNNISIARNFLKQHSVFLRNELFSLWMN